jgi:hypothetical protein
VIPNATDHVGHVHDNMPRTVARDNWTDWLGPASSALGGEVGGAWFVTDFGQFCDLVRYDAHQDREPGRQSRLP